MHPDILVCGKRLGNGWERWGSGGAAERY